MSTKVYIAGPMRGIPHFNVGAFNTAAYELRKEGYTVFNPAENEEQGTTFAQYMRLDLAWIIAEAEALFALPNWDMSIGALTEMHVAHTLGLPVYSYLLWDESRLLQEIKGLWQIYRTSGP